ncbi:hypothetical protein AVEN_35967-1 [Araneus ventricosus]|uniref:Uncharacterized protein n=1 Tax=Araneus ventricosus TaxID=182803 RepID=A0A4Y2U754_ARAVE|nr:hypothetical protein AVEN_35967-1 [Araneus ventricosus]
MIDEDLQKFSESRVMRTIAIGKLPIRNLPKMNAETTQKKYLQLADINAGDKTPSPLATKISPYMLKRTAEYKEILKRLNDVHNIKCKTE